MPWIKATDIAYGRFRAPDLDVMEEFLTRFGLVRAARTSTALYMRGTDPATIIHVTEKGEPEVVALAYCAASEDDLVRVAKAPGASAVENIDEPGGGKRVRLTEPNGYRIEVVHGIEPLPPIPSRQQPLNSGTEPTASRRRADATAQEVAVARQADRPRRARARRNCDETVEWFRDTLGFLSLGRRVRGRQVDHLIGSFNRCDRGDDYVDHHTSSACGTRGRASTTCRSRCRTSMRRSWTTTTSTSFGKYEHMWGVGRHVLGSQVYDYWADPWGRVHEHWADSDRLNLRERVQPRFGRGVARLAVG